MVEKTCINIEGKEDEEKRSPRIEGKDVGGRREEGGGATGGARETGSS